MIFILMASIDDPLKRDFFLDIYQKYNTEFESYAYHCLKNEMNAEEVLSDFYKKIIDHLDFIIEKKKENLESYLITALENQVRDYIRKKKIEQKYILSLENIEVSFEVDFDKQIEDKETSEKLRIIMQELPDDIRLVLLLKYNSRLKLREIAKFLDMSISTVKYKKKKGLDFFKKKLKDMGITND